jgi:hypothetical protein
MIMIRRSLSRFAIVVMAALPILIQPARRFAQQQESQPKQEKKQPDAQPQGRAEQEPSVRISTQLVQIDLTVTDKKGERIEDLIWNPNSLGMIPSFGPADDGSQSDAECATLFAQFND